jgi:hypothetical protein
MRIAYLHGIFSGVARNLRKLTKICCLSTLAIACFALAGCQTTPPEVQTRIIEIPSSKPYDFIHYTDKTDEATAKRIRKHNRRHAAVIAAEQKAKQ